MASESKSKISLVTISRDRAAERSISSTADSIKADANLLFLATVLDQVIDQIFILNRGQTLYHKSPSQNTESVIEDPIFDQETGKPYEIAFNEKKYTKMPDTSVWYAAIAEAQKEEFLEQKSFLITRNTTIQHMDEIVEHDRLFAEEKVNFAKMNALKETLLTETRDSHQRIQNLNEVLSTIHDENQIILFRDMLRCRYMTEWEKSRNEQNSLFCKQKEKELQTIIDNYKIEIEKETRINAEIEMFIIGNHEEMEGKIEEWMEKYDKETESRNVEIQMLKEKRDEQVNAYKELQERFEEHKKAIENYLDFKDTARKEAEYRQELETMATRIQAWWRGLMVRLKLGPFKPKKGKKGMNDKKTGKKK